MKTVTEYLKYKFSEKELREKSEKLAQDCREKRETEEAKKQITSDLKAKIDAFDASISQISNHINSGYEFRYIECDVHLNDPDPGFKSIVRKDTFEVVKVEPMTAAELQEELDFGGAL